MADAIVIGGGVMGLAAARALRRRDHAVTLLERRAAWTASTS
jgi:glycine/D-amino acid oxidase-like deaminating enzyme